MKKTFAEAIEVLLAEGVDEPREWMLIPRFDSRVLSGLPFSAKDSSWEEEFWRLHEHHLHECAFLRDVIAELRARLLKGSD